MNPLIGIKGKNFIVTASDMNASSSIIKHELEVPRTHRIENTIITYTGDLSEGERLINFVIESARFQNLQYDVDIKPKTISKMMGNQIANNLRRKQYGVSAIIAGKDKNEYEMYVVDFYGARLKANCICVGYSNYFGNGILDKGYKADMSVNEAIELIQKVLKCLKDKFLMSYTKYIVNIQDENGYKEMILN